MKDSTKRFILVCTLFCQLGAIATRLGLTAYITSFVRENPGSSLFCVGCTITFLSVLAMLLSEMQPKHEREPLEDSNVLAFGLLGCIVWIMAGCLPPARSGDAAVSGVTSSSYTLTLPANKTCVQVFNGVDWNPKTGYIKWVPAAAEIKP